MEAANLSKEKDGKVVGISLCNQIKLEETLGGPYTPLYLSFDPISLYPSINLDIEAAKLSKEKKRKVVGISLCNRNKLEETNGSPSRDPYTPHLFIFQRWNHSISPI